jgi:hypothetical protein
MKPQLAAQTLRNEQATPTGKETGKETWKEARRTRLIADSFWMGGLGHSLLTS